jgi:hypothetical protein
MKNKVINKGSFVPIKYLGLYFILFFFILICNVGFSQNEPSLLFPFNNEVTNKQQILFKWNKNPLENESFQFQLATDSLFGQLVSDLNLSTNQVTNSGFGPSNQSYFWRVRKLNPTSSWSEIRKLSYFNPRNISGLTVWLDPTIGCTLNAGGIFQINDQSIVGNNALQVNATQQPLFVPSDTLINNQPSIKFDGVNDFLDIIDNTTIDFTSEFTTFTLIKPRLVASNKTILAKWDYATQGAWVLQTDFTFSDELMFSPCFTITDPGNQKYYTTNADLLAQRPVLITMKYQGNQQQKALLYKNTNLLQSTIVGTIPSILPNCSASLKVGKYGGVATRYFDGDITEVLIYNSSLLNTSKDLVENYLRYKYAPPVCLGPDTLIAANSNCGNIQLKAQFRYTNYLWSTGATTSRINVQNPGTYWVRVTDFMGNISSDTIKVLPPYSYNYPQGNVVCAGDTSYWTTNFPPTSFNFLWSDGSTSPSLPILDSGQYYVRVTDLSGCVVNSDTINFNLDSYSLTASLGNDTSLCLGNSIQLQSGQLETVLYSWNDGSSNSTFLVNNPGINNITLQSTNTNGCLMTDSIIITVVGIAPTLNYSIPNEICQFDSLIFSDNSFVPNPYSISEVKWIFNGVDTVSQTSGHYLPELSGALNVLLEVNSAQCQNTANFNVTVHPKPSISFTTQNYCPYEEIEFTPQNSTFSILNSTFWNFSDNTTSTSSNPTHVFGTTDTYNVSLQAQDINGCRDTVVQAVYIQPAPVADFTFNNTCELSVVNFVNNSTIADTFSVVTNQWLYGDNTQATNPSIQKVYQTYGDYNVQLIVTANNGCQDTLSQNIIIHPKPILGWQVGPACKNTWTTFENQSTIPLGSIIQTDWLVNLQYPLEGTSSAYKFVTTGVQYLNLTSTSDQGCITDTLVIVNVQPEINAAYAVNPTIVVAGVPVLFTNTSTGGTQYEWNLGNDSIIQTVTTLPIQVSGFTASFIGDSLFTYLAIQNSIGCKDTAFQYLKVNEPRIDLAINQLFIQDVNGFYKVGVELRNLGFVEITQTDLLLKLFNSSPILETETESLAPGEARIYLFNANPSAFVSTQDNEISYLCVEATSYNNYQLIETELSNNISCLNTEDGNFVLLPIYPNPTNTDISYTLVVSEESIITTSLSDETGRIVQSSNESYASGLHSPTISMRNLSAGVYYFQISDGVTSKTVKILKN